MDGPVTWGAIEYFIGLVVAVLTVAGVIWGVFSARITKMENAHLTRITKLETDLVDFKLHVIQNYVQHPNMEKVEKRLLDAIGSLSEQIEKLRGVLTTRTRRTPVKD